MSGVRFAGARRSIHLPADPKELEDAIDDALAEHPDNGDVLSAVVLQANPKKIVAIRQNSETIEISGEGLVGAIGLSDKAAPKIKILHSRRDPRRADAEGHLGNHATPRGGGRFRVVTPMMVAPAIFG